MHTKTSDSSPPPPNQNRRCSLTKIGNTSEQLTYLFICSRLLQVPRCSVVARNRHNRWRSLQGLELEPGVGLHSSLEVCASVTREPVVDSRPVRLFRPRKRKWFGAVLSSYYYSVALQSLFGQRNDQTISPLSHLRVIDSGDFIF